MLGDVGLGQEGGGEHQPDFALLKHVAGAVAQSRFGAGVGYQLVAESGLVEVGRLLGVADVEFEVIGAFEGEEILGGLGQYFGRGHRMHGRRGKWVVRVDGVKIRVYLVLAFIWPGAGRANAISRGCLANHSHFCSQSSALALPMNTEELNRALVALIEKKAELHTLKYDDARYDDVEEALHDLEDDFNDEYGDYLETALDKVHTDLQSDTDVLLPTAYLPSNPGSTPSAQRRRLGRFPRNTPAKKPASRSFPTLCASCSPSASRCSRSCGKRSSFANYELEEMLYRIAEHADWQYAQQNGFFASADLAAEGFIHSSEQHQILETARRYYAGRADLVLLEWDEAALMAAGVARGARMGA